METNKDTVLYPVKHLYEIAFWSRVHEKGGPNAFKSDKCLHGIHNKYLDALQIGEDYFEGKVVVDIGCGPRGSLHLFKAERKYGIDPLSTVYRTLFGIKNHEMTYLSDSADNISLPSDSIDIVISVNSLDHVDDLKHTVYQVWRILKDSGEFRINYNLLGKQTHTEPLWVPLDSLLVMLEDTFTEVSVLKEFPRGGAVPYERVLISCVK